MYMEHVKFLENMVETFGEKMDICAQSKQAVPTRIFALKLFFVISCWI